MNSIIQSLLSNPSMLGKLGEKSGLDISSVGGVVAGLAPALMKKAKENLDSDEDSSPLLDLLGKSDPERLDENEGNAILAQLTGSKDKSRSLASEVASSAGVDVSSVTKLLPLVAPMVMGMLNKQSNGANDTSSLTSMLGSFLDQDNDGSVADDLMGMAKKFF